MRNLRRIREHGFKDGYKKAKEEILEVIDEFKPSEIYGSIIIWKEELKARIKGE